jgi:hypothetical protein
VWRQRGSCAVCLNEVQGASALSAHALSDAIDVLSGCLAAVGAIHRLDDRELALALPVTSQQDAEAMMCRTEVAARDHPAFGGAPPG